VFTGVMIASAFSVKFVGLFVVILVGIHTAVDLLDVLGDLFKPIVSDFTSC
jgi:dolichyl-phosphate-mannose-protein mannosyltransferase